MEEAIRAKSASIATIRLALPDIAKGILTLFINDLLKFLNLGLTMSVNQVEMTVELILNDTLTKNLKPEDLKVAFDQFKKTGKSYNRIDGQTIFEILYKYAGEKADFVEMISINGHGNEVAKTPMVDPKVIEMYKEVIRLRQEGKISRSPLVPTDIKIEDKEIDGKKVKYSATFVEPAAVTKKEKRKPVKTARDIFIQKCFDEFDELWRKREFAVQSGTGRYIKFEDEIVDQVEYTKIRVKVYDKNTSKDLQP